MIDLGSGPPLVLVPGVQGRWEWMRPAVQALARRLRVVTFSLCGDPDSDARVDAALGFEGFTAQIDRALDRAGLEAAAICGVSYGGLIAAHYAARRPERVTSLIIVSAPGPGWRPGCRVDWYVRFPRLLAPLFFLTSPARLWREIVAAHDTWPARVRSALGHFGRVLRAPCSPVRMAERVRLLAAVSMPGDCALIASPALVVTGEGGLDRVVSVAGTREFARAIRNARVATLERTGHIGLVTRPERFAEIVADFVIEHDRGSVARASEVPEAPEVPEVPGVPRSPGSPGSGLGFRVEEPR